MWKRHMFSFPFIVVRSFYVFFDFFSSSLSFFAFLICTGHRNTIFIRRLFSFFSRFRFQAPFVVSFSVCVLFVFVSIFASFVCLFMFCISSNRFHFYLHRPQTRSDKIQFQIESNRSESFNCFRSRFAFSLNFERIRSTRRTCECAGVACVFLSLTMSNVPLKRIELNRSLAFNASLNKTVRSLFSLRIFLFHCECEINSVACRSRVARMFVCGSCWMQKENTEIWKRDSQFEFNCVWCHLIGNLSTCDHFIVVNRNSFFNLFDEECESSVVRLNDCLENQTKWSDKISPFFFTLFSRLWHAKYFVFLVFFVSFSFAFVTWLHILTHDERKESKKDEKLFLCVFSLSRLGNEEVCRPFSQFLPVDFTFHLVWQNCTWQNATNKRNFERISFIFWSRHENKHPTFQCGEHNHFSASATINYRKSNSNRNK